MTQFLPWRIPKSQWPAADSLLRAEKSGDPDDWAQAALAYQEINRDLHLYCLRMSNALRRRETLMQSLLNLFKSKKEINHNVNSNVAR